MCIKTYNILLADTLNHIKTYMKKIYTLYILPYVYFLDGMFFEFYSHAPRD